MTAPRLIIPLLDKARARMNQQVTVYIAGGIKVTGRLTAADDTDLTLTVVDRDLEYDIALGSVAVIEGAR